MKQKLLNLTRLRSLLLLACVMLGVSAWGDPTVLFHETFGNNTGSARTWDNSYSVKSGVESVYSGITGYTITNAKQGKNTTGSTQSGLIQSSSESDAILIVGPLNVKDYSSLKVTYQWKAASIKGTYSTSLYYATSPTGSYSEITGTGAGATTFVERSYSLPEAAQVSTLYLKIIWKTSNTQAIIDELELTGIDGSISTLAESDFALTGAPVALTFDLYNNSSAQTIIYTTSSTGAVTVSGGTGYVTTSVNESAKTITVTPTAKTSSAQTITVSQAADDTYAAGEATFTVSVDDSTPFTGGVVTFDATTDKGASPLSKDPVTMSCSNGLLNNGTEYRFYKNSETTFSVPEGYYISQIVFTNADDDNPCSNLARKNGTSGEYTNNTWTGASRAATFVASAQARASMISVTVASGTPTPIIIAENVNLAYSSTSGSITASIQNSVSGGVLSANSSESWLSIGTISGNTVTLTCEANTASTTRESTVTLTYTYNTDQTVTKTVTVTQAAAPVTTTNTYRLVTTINSGKHYIITNGTNKAMGQQNANNRSAVNINISNGSTIVPSTAGVCEFVIEGNNSDGYTIFDASIPGYLYAASSGSNHLKTEEQYDYNGLWTISIDNSDAATITAQGSNSNKNMRYNSNSSLFSCYSSGQSAVYLYELVETLPTTGTITLNAACTDGNTIYGTFFTNQAYTMPEGLTGSVVNLNNGKIVLTEAYAAGDVVPKETALLISTTANFTGTRDYPITYTTGGEAPTERNLLKGTMTTNGMTVGKNYKFYRLTMHNGTKLGFYWGAQNGGAFKPGANKAYLAISTDEARLGFDVGGEQSGIESVIVTTNDSNVFDLQGRRVAQPQKGLYIVNGKKIVIK